MSRKKINCNAFVSWIRRERDQDSLMPARRYTTGAGGSRREKI